MENNIENNKIVFISNFWKNKIIPAILLKENKVLPNYIDVWIPSGYDNGDGSYSSRTANEIYEFTGSNDIKNDILEKWNIELNLLK